MTLSEKRENGMNLRAVVETKFTGLQTSSQNWRMRKEERRLKITSIFLLWKNEWGLMGEAVFALSEDLSGVDLSRRLEMYPMFTGHKGL